MKLGKYRHYKDKYYKVIGLAQHTETKEKVVVYQALYDCDDLADEYGIRPLFVRPYEMFFDFVTHKGTRIQRFLPVD